MVKKWVRAEILILRQCAGTMTVECIGMLIGRSEAAVRTKARELGISMMLRRQSAKYPQSDIELARQLHQRGVSGEKSPENLNVRCAQ